MPLSSRQKEVGVLPNRPPDRFGAPGPRHRLDHAGHLLTRHPGDAGGGGGADCRAGVRGGVALNSKPNGTGSLGTKGRNYTQHVGSARRTEMSEIENIRDWRGKDVLDSGGELSAEVAWPRGPVTVPSALPIGGAIRRSSEGRCGWQGSWSHQSTGSSWVSTPIGTSTSP